MVMSFMMGKNLHKAWVLTAVNVQLSKNFLAKNSPVGKTTVDGSQILH